MNSCLLLNSDYLPINQISIKKAIKLIFKQKVEIIKYSDQKIHVNMYKPQIIRLLHSISHFYNRKIPWSKQNVFIRDEYYCQYCGIQVTKKTASIDHVIPKSKGGGNSFSNTVCACKNCNAKKSDKFLDEVNMQLLKKPKIPNLIDFISIKFKNYHYDYQ